MIGMHNFKRGFIDRALQYGLTEKQAEDIYIHEAGEDPNKTKKMLGTMGLGAAAPGGYNYLQSKMPDLSKTVQNLPEKIKAPAEAGLMGRLMPGVGKARNVVASKSKNILSSLSKVMAENPKGSAAGILLPLLLGGAYAINSPSRQ
jgi:hypothetical protein